jgi:hypothetical protein
VRGVGLAQAGGDCDPPSHILGCARNKIDPLVHRHSFPLPVTLSSAAATAPSTLPPPAALDTLTPLLSLFSHPTPLRGLPRSPASARDTGEVRAQDAHRLRQEEPARARCTRCAALVSLTLADTPIGASYQRGTTTSSSRRLLAHRAPALSELLACRQGAPIVRLQQAAPALRCDPHRHPCCPPFTGPPRAAFHPPISHPRPHPPPACPCLSAASSHVSTAGSHLPAPASRLATLHPFVALWCRARWRGSERRARMRRALVAPVLSSRSVAAPISPPAYVLCLSHRPLAPPPAMSEPAPLLLGLYSVHISIPV